MAVLPTPMKRRTLYGFDTIICFKKYRKRGLMKPCMVTLPLPILKKLRKILYGWETIICVKGIPSPRSWNRVNLGRLTSSVRHRSLDCHSKISEVICYSTNINEMKELFILSLYVSKETKQPHKPMQTWRKIVSKIDFIFYF